MEGRFEVGSTKELVKDLRGGVRHGAQRAAPFTEGRRICARGAQQAILTREQKHDVTNRDKAM